MNATDASGSPDSFRHTVFSFGCIQGAQILLPLLALPWLARVLESDAFGLLMYMGVISVCIGQIMDWGFALGAVRDAAALRQQPQALRQLLGEVLSAKALLAAACCAAALLALPVLPHAADWPGAFALAVLGGLVRGLNPTWFFQGAGWGMRRMALWDVLSSAAVLALTLLWVRTPQDWPVYLTLLFVCKGLAYGWLHGELLRRYGGAPCSPARGWQALCRTRALFASVLFALIYNGGAQLLLGYFLAPRYMGMLMAADKVVRAVVSVSAPVTQALFPEICARRAVARHETAKMLRLSLGWTATVMVCAAVAVWGAAPWIMAVALGQGYAESVSLLRCMTPLIPVLACNYVFGTQTLVSFGQERALVRAQGLTALCSLPLAALLAHYGGAVGAACLAPVQEAFLLVLLVWAIRRWCPQAFACEKGKG